MMRDETPGRTSDEHQYERTRLGPEDYEWQHPPDWPGDYWPSRHERAAKDLIDFMTGNVDPRSLFARQARGEEVWDLSVQPYRASLAKRSKELFFLCLAHARAHGFPNRGAYMRVRRQEVVDSFRAQWCPDRSYEERTGVAERESGMGFVESKAVARASAELSQKRVPYRLWRVLERRAGPHLNAELGLDGKGWERGSFDLLTLTPSRGLGSRNGDGVGGGGAGHAMAPSDSCAPRDFLPMPEAYAVRWGAETQRALEGGLFALVDPAAYLSLASGWEQALYSLLAEALRWEAERALERGSAPGDVRGVSFRVRAGALRSMSDVYAGASGSPELLESRLNVIDEEGTVPWLAPALDTVARTGLFTWRVLPECEWPAVETPTAAPLDSKDGGLAVEGALPIETSDEAVLAFTLALSADEVEDALITRVRTSESGGGDVWRSILILFQQPGEDEETNYLRWLW